MKYVDEFRRSADIKRIAAQINRLPLKRQVNIMEVCGTHTHNFFRFGLDTFLPSSLTLISGPGCPVCVSSQDYIDTAIEYAKMKNAVIISFGDMLRVPGTRSTLEKERAAGADVRMVYSPLDALVIAQQNPRSKVIFLGVGFETTIPTIALALCAAYKDNIKNLFFCNSLKLIPPAMEQVLDDSRVNISGFLCPGHVSAIIGTNAYAGLSRKYHVSCCVAGFEPFDIMEGIYLLVSAIVAKKPVILNQYIRAVNSMGNPKARKIIYDVFQPCDASWRGLGTIPESGLKMRKKYARFDAEKEFPLPVRKTIITNVLKRCRCGDVLKGLILPSQCPAFTTRCSPENPLGPCMVSTEGACHAYYKYRSKK